MSESEVEDAKEKRSKQWEILFGLTLAIFAAILAVCDLGGGKYGDDEIMTHNDMASKYLWYQSKGIKQTLVEGQANFLQTLMDSGSIDRTKAEAVAREIEKLRAKSERYDKEKNEILLGSAKVGKENWVQEVDGELGKVVGAQELEELSNKLGKVGDIFDNGTLFLQMCLVLGAIGIIVDGEGIKRAFFAGMVVLGLVGSYFTYVAYQAAGSM